MTLTYCLDEGNRPYVKFVVSEHTSFTYQFTEPDAITRVSEQVELFVTTPEFTYAYDTQRTDIPLAILCAQIYIQEEMKSISVIGKHFGWQAESKRGALIYEDLARAILESGLRDIPVLDLSHLNITVLPAHVDLFANLRTLDLRYNETVIPPEGLQERLPHLETFVSNEIPFTISSACHLHLDPHSHPAHELID